MDKFTHLTTFGISGAMVPARKAQSLLSARAQVDCIESILREQDPSGPRLRETREPDLARVNYMESVREAVSILWQPLVEEPAAVPPPQLLEQLNSAWKSAEKKVGGEAQENAANIFAQRQSKKTQILRDEASGLAASKGLPAAVRWLEGIGKECAEARKVVGDELARYGIRKKRQSESLEDLKDDWGSLLSSDDTIERLPLRFLFLAGWLGVAGVVLWLLTIPINSLIGVVTVCVSLLLILHVARPLFRRLRLSRRKAVVASKLVSAYRGSSLFSLDEMAKRLEVEYWRDLGEKTDELRRAFEERIALLKSRRSELEERKNTRQATLLDSPPTIRPILRPTALAEWYEQGRSQIPANDWTCRFGSLERAPGWEAMDQEALRAFAFLREIRADDELLRLCPGRDERLKFLESLRVAAIGVSPGEALLSLDFSATGGKPPQVYLAVEVNDPDHSALAEEIKVEWSGAGVGLLLERTSDPTAITLLSLVYGYAPEAQKDWESIERAFEQSKKTEGRGIFPVLFDDEEEKL